MRLRALALGLVEDLLRPISGSLGIALRRAYYRRRLKRCGSNLRIASGVYLDGPEHMSFGDWVVLDRNVIITAGPVLVDERTRTIANPNCKAMLGEVIIGDRCHLANGSIVQGHGGVSIGRAFGASAGVMIYSLSNSPTAVRGGHVDVPGYSVPRILTPVAIGNNVWLGLKAIVVGNTIGDNCFIKPLSLVTSDIPSNTIAAGVPAKPERVRFHDLEQTQPSKAG